MACSCFYNPKYGEKSMPNNNNKYVNFMDPVNLAQYLAELTKQCVEYVVIKETDGSHSVLIVGF